MGPTNLHEFVIWFDIGDKCGRDEARFKLHAYVYTHKQKNTHTHTHVDVHGQMHIYVDIHKHKHTHAHIIICTHVRTYMYTHTHTQWCEAHPQCNRQLLREFLVIPMQRLTKYPLLIKAISNKTEDHCIKQRLLGIVSS